jgi:hypothetical protein
MDELLARIDLPAVERIVCIGSEEVTVRVMVRWENSNRRRLRIHAAAEGPSCWRMDRPDESVVVTPQIAELRSSV